MYVFVVAGYFPKGKGSPPCLTTPPFPAGSKPNPRLPIIPNTESLGGQPNKYVRGMFANVVYNYKVYFIIGEHNGRAHNEPLMMWLKP